MDDHIIKGQKGRTMSYKEYLQAKEELKYFISNTVTLDSEEDLDHLVDSLMAEKLIDYSTFDFN